MKDIAKKSNTEYLCNKYNMAPTKKFGQNFLIDLNTIKNIVSKENITKDTCVIEIGPGIGALTEQLAISAKKVIAFEIDERLKPVLAESLEEYDNVEIIFQDILTVDLKRIVSELKKDYQRVEIVANLPYYITTDILIHIIESNCDIDAMHTMVQLEVADKLTNSKTKSPLTYMIESIGYIKKDMVISKNVFYPKPHIDSAIISIYKERDYSANLSKILNLAFTQKRKTIYNNLKDYFKEDTLHILEETKIDPKLRPEQLTINDYLNLGKYIKVEL